MQRAHLTQLRPVIIGGIGEGLTAYPVAVVALEFLEYGPPIGGISFGHREAPIARMMMRLDGLRSIALCGFAG